MISIPDFFVGGVCRFEFVLRKPSDGVTSVNADATPTIVVVKNGSDTVESATVAATGATGGYKVSYTPGSYAEGDFYAFRVTAAITDADFNGGSAFNHVETFTSRVKAVERGTDGANTTAPATLANVTDARDAVLEKLPETGRANAVAPLDAVGTRNAVGLAAANLDTQLAAIGLKTANLPADPASEETILEAIDEIGGGPATTPRELTFTSGDNPVVGATVTITETDGTVIWIGTTNSSGVVTPSLAAGSYRAYLEKAGFLPNNPYNFTVT